MKIGVDMHVLNGLYQGSRRHLENIYSAAREMDTKNDYFFFVNDPDKISKEWKQRGKILSFNAKSKFVRLIFSAPTASRREKLDVFHFQYIAPIRSSCPVVLTVHDVLFETHPQFFPQSFVIRSKALVRWSSKKSAHIFTVSNYCKTKIQEIYKIPDDKISITSNAADFEMFHPNGSMESKRLIYNKWGISNFMLTIGRLEPRKNHIMLLKAYSMLKERGIDLPQLVIVGQRDFGYQDIFKEIAKKKLEHSVTILEKVDDEWIPHLYRSALFFIYPSYAEGFGIPPLEAMACGCPVISSDTTALPETIGKAGLFLDPYNAEDMAEKMKQLIEADSLRSRLSGLGVSQARKFSWKESAKALLAGLGKARN